MSFFEITTESTEEGDWIAHGCISPLVKAEGGGVKLHEGAPFAYEDEDGPATVKRFGRGATEQEAFERYVNGHISF